MRGADAVAMTLRAAGVERIFTLSGNQIMPVFDACLDADIDLLHVRQEAAAVHMADAWGRLTGQPGVALVTAGPGFANTLTGLYVATISESPLVLLSGCATMSQHAKGAFQAMAQAEIASHVSKASWTAETPSGLPNDIRRALDIATSGRPGPVHIALPFNTVDGEVDSPEDALVSGGVGVIVGTYHRRRRCLACAVRVAWCEDPAHLGRIYDDARRRPGGPERSFRRVRRSRRGDGESAWHE